MGFAKILVGMGIGASIVTMITAIFLCFRGLDGKCPIEDRFFRVFSTLSVVGFLGALAIKYAWQ